MELGKGMRLNHWNSSLKLNLHVCGSPTVHSISGIARDFLSSNLATLDLQLRSCSFAEGLTTTGRVPRYILPILFSILSEHRRLF
jgi:hypothetical protein